MESTHVVFKNVEGVVVRTLFWTGEVSLLIYRFDTNRMELCSDSTQLDIDCVKYLKLKDISLKDLEGEGVSIVGYGSIVKASNSDAFSVDAKLVEEDSEIWWKALGSVALLAFLSVGTILNITISEEALKEELREHVVKIIKRRPIKKIVSVPASRFYNTKPSKKITKKVVKRSVKRMGALAVLGSLSRSKQKGGINLGQVKVSRGPGLGGTQGSGGVQTSLYGKGIVSAPVGVGGNIRGAGGYGTKGKGGGRAGYGKLSLIGSSGTDLIPLGREAIINGGLDRDLISAVIQRNMGQVRFCYERGLQSDPKLSGRVAVKFSIGANGRVKVASLGNTTLHSKLVEDCILLRLKSWKFPLPEGGSDVKVSYPFMLKRHGQS